MNVTKTKNSKLGIGMQGTQSGYVVSWNNVHGISLWHYHSLN